MIGSISVLQAKCISELLETLPSDVRQNRRGSTVVHVTRASPPAAGSSARRRLRSYTIGSGAPGVNSGSSPGHEARWLGLGLGLGLELAKAKA